jgi:hypothetical protein
MSFIFSTLRKGPFIIRVAWLGVVCYYTGGRVELLKLLFCYLSVRLDAFCGSFFLIPPPPSCRHRNGCQLVKTHSVDKYVREI